jgi:hypothetical protein
MAAERLHGDDTTVPVLAEGKTDTGRCWVYVRDDKPFGGAGPPAAMFYYSRNRRGEHPQAHLAGYSGIFQADAFEGYGKLYNADRKPGPIKEAACWVHLWMPPLLQGLNQQLDKNPRLLSSIRPVMTTRPAPSALMVNPQAETQSRVTSSRLDAPSGFIQLRFARFRHHTLKDSSHPRRPLDQPCLKIYRRLRGLPLRRPVNATVPQQRPYDARRLVGKRDSRDIGGPAITQARQPCP